MYLINPLISVQSSDLSDALESQKIVCNTLLMKNIKSNTETMRHLDAKNEDEGVSYDLTITIHQCRDLPVCDFWTRSSDPFVNLAVKTNVSLHFQTITKWKTLHPVWDEKVIWPVHSVKDNKLYVNVYDDDNADLTSGVLTNDHIGYVDINLEEILAKGKEGSWKQWHNLEQMKISLKKKKKKRPIPAIELSLHLSRMLPSESTRMPSQLQGRRNVSIEHKTRELQAIKEDKDNPAAQGSTKFVFVGIFLLASVILAMALGPIEGRQQSLSA